MGLRMDNTITVSDGTISHVFGMASLSAGKSQRNSRQALATTPILAVVQQSKKAGVTRANIKFSLSYLTTAGVLKTLQFSTAMTLPDDAPAALVENGRTLMKNFMGDANLYAQLRGGEL